MSLALVSCDMYYFFHVSDLFRCGNTEYMSLDLNNCLKILFSDQLNAMRYEYYLLEYEL